MIYAELFVSLQKNIFYEIRIHSRKQQQTDGREPAF